MNIPQNERDLHALEIARILATDYFGDAIRVDRGVRLYTSDMVDLENHVVMSEGSWGVYHVTTHTCQCPDYRRRGEACKHVIALCLAVKVKQLLGHQWYGTVDGEASIVTIIDGLLLTQTETDPEPKRCDAARVLLGGHCDTIDRCGCGDETVCGDHYDAAYYAYYQEQGWNV